MALIYKYKCIILSLYEMTDRLAWILWRNVYMAYHSNESGLWKNSTWKVPYGLIVLSAASATVSPLRDPSIMAWIYKGLSVIVIHNNPSPLSPAKWQSVTSELPVAGDLSGTEVMLICKFWHCAMMIVTGLLLFIIPKRRQLAYTKAACTIRQGDWLTTEEKLYKALSYVYHTILSL